MKLRNKTEEILESMAMQRAEKYGGWFGFLKGRSNFLNEMQKRKVCDKDGNIINIDNFSKIKKEKLGNSVVKERINDINNNISEFTKKLLEGWDEDDGTSRDEKVNKLFDDRGTMRPTLVLMDLGLDQWPIELYSVTTKDDITNDGCFLNENSAYINKIDENYYNKWKRYVTTESDDGNTLYDLIKKFYLRIILGQATRAVQLYKNDPENKTVNYKAQYCANVKRVVKNIYYDDKPLSMEYDQILKNLSMQIFKTLVVKSGLKRSPQELEEGYKKQAELKGSEMDGPLTDGSWTLGGGKSILLTLGGMALDYINEEKKKVEQS